MMSNRQKGIISIVISAFGFALMAFFVRLCDNYGNNISCFQKGFFRNAIALLLTLVVFVRETHAEHGSAAFLLPRFRRFLAPAWGVLLTRAICGTIGIFANFYALSHIDIGEAMTLNKTAPFFTVLAAAVFLNEKMNKRQLIGLLVAFVGATLVIKPGMRTDDLFAAMMALTGGIAAGIAYTCVRQLGRMRANGAFIVLFFSAFSCLVCVPFILFNYNSMTFAQLLILLGAGVGAAIGQFGITAAYRYAEPRFIAVFDYSNVIFTAMLGFVFLGQIPDVVSVLGFAVILFAAIKMR